MSVDQLNEACEKYDGEGYTYEDFATCKLECCHASDECEDAKVHLELYNDSDSEDDLELTIIDEAQVEATLTEEQPCPEDVNVLKLNGVTEFPLNQNTVEIVSQDKDTVIVNLNQQWFESDAGTDQFVDAIYYSWMPGHFKSECEEVTSVRKGDVYAKQLTIQCMKTSPVARLEICVVDDLQKGFLKPKDDAMIPKCCHPTVEDTGKATVCYSMEINCETACPVNSFEKSPERRQL